MFQVTTKTVDNSKMLAVLEPVDNLWINRWITRDLPTSSRLYPRYVHKLSTSYPQAHGVPYRPTGQVLALFPLIKILDFPVPLLLSLS